MRGPDFDLGHVTEWRIGTDGVALLALADSSRWSMASSGPQFAGVRTTVELAQRLGVPIFVSGNRHSGSLERVALPEKLIPAQLATEPADGKLAVVFHGPPTPAYLHTDRPWFAAARALLLSSIAQDSPRAFPPPLLVTIDVVTREIMDVRTP